MLLKLFCDSAGREEKADLEMFNRRLPFLDPETFGAGFSHSKKHITDLFHFCVGKTTFAVAAVVGMWKTFLGAAESFPGLRLLLEDSGEAWTISDVLIQQFFSQRICSQVLSSYPYCSWVSSSLCIIITLCCCTLLDGYSFQMFWSGETWRRLQRSLKQS